MATCLILDGVVGSLFLAFRGPQLPSTGWAVMLVVPVVLAATHKHPWLRIAQVVWTIGMLVAAVGSAPEPSSAVALHAFTVGGSLLAAGVITDRLVRQGRRQVGVLHTASETDRLTGVLNRRGLQAAYIRIAGEAAASDQPVAVITADLDAMKRINDVYGHAVGDQVLQQLADRLTRAAPGAAVARIGGDEHVIVVAGKPDPVLRDLELLLEEEPLEPAAGVSFGIAVGAARPGLEWLWDLIGRADQKLYEAKLHSRRRSRSHPVISKDKSTPDNRRTLGAVDSALQVGKLLPTREQRQLYALFIAWVAVVGTASAMLQLSKQADGSKPNLLVLAAGLIIAGAMAWGILRPAAARSGLTAVLIAAAAMLTLIAVTTRQPSSSDTGVVLWAPLLLLIGRYWPRTGIFCMYGWLIALVTFSHLQRADFGSVASLKLFLQVVALIVATEIVYNMRGRQEKWVSHLTASALTDPLTGLTNRRGLDVEATRLGGESVTALAIDIDRFKQVNDQYGHAIGDATLVAVARVLESSSPPGAVVARLGGDEFLVVGADLPHATLIPQLQQATQNLPKPISISIGAASSDLMGAPDDLWQLINAADQDLLASRRQPPASSKSGGSQTTLQSESDSS